MKVNEARTLKMHELKEIENGKLFGEIFLMALMY